MELTDIIRIQCFSGVLIQGISTNQGMLLLLLI